jgi:hypothetical protein
MVTYRIVDDIHLASMVALYKKLEGLALEYAAR